ncbi:MAG: pilus assembly protein [Acidobacteria bacterium]|nr:pilus assembly protein [Acidobacteriota bacterium]
MPQRAHKKSERGQTMVEFALVLPIFVVLLFGIVQFGIAFNNYITLTDAARAGARKAAVSRNSTDPAGQCKAAVMAAADNLDSAVLGPTVSCASTWAPGSEVTVHAEYPYEISLLDWAVFSGQLTTTMKERVE